MDEISGIAGFQLLGFVIAANLLTLAFVWGIWTLNRAEKITGDPNNATWWAYAAAIVPLLILGFSGYLGIIAE